MCIRDSAGVCLAGEDLDADGVVDAGETDPRAADTDFDGLPDSERDDYGTDPLDNDSDDGGVLDGAEIIAGTDPLDPSDDFNPTTPTREESSTSGCDDCASGTSSVPLDGLALAALVGLFLARRRRLAERSAR